MNYKPLINLQIQINTIGKDSKTLPYPHLKMGKRIKTVLVKRLLQEYPPKHFWACDDIAIEEKWAPALKNRKMKDDRDKREDSTYLLDEAEFRDAGGIVFENESVIYRDETTKEVVGVVIRNLINHPGLLEWLDSRVKLACKERRYSRVSKSVNL